MSPQPSHALAHDCFGEKTVSKELLSLQSLSQWPGNADPVAHGSPIACTWRVGSQMSSLRVFQVKLPRGQDWFLY